MTAAFRATLEESAAVDLVPAQEIPDLVQRWKGTAISAHDRQSLHALLERIEACVMQLPRLTAPQPYADDQ